MIRRCPPGWVRFKSSEIYDRYVFAKPPRRLFRLFRWPLFIFLKRNTPCVSRNTPITPRFYTHRDRPAETDNIRRGKWNTQQFLLSLERPDGDLLHWKFRITPVKEGRFHQRPDWRCGWVFDALCEGWQISEVARERLARGNLHPSWFAATTKLPLDEIREEFWLFRSNYCARVLGCAISGRILLALMFCITIARSSTIFFNFWDKRHKPLNRRAKEMVLSLIACFEKQLQNAVPLLPLKPIREMSVQLFSFQLYKYIQLLLVESNIWYVSKRILYKIPLHVHVSTFYRPVSKSL